MTSKLSIAVETSSRSGGLALGRDDTLVDEIQFDATRRHASQLVTQMDVLLRRNGAGPEDVDALYVSGGPGSFTGTRLAITVARTFAQAMGGVKLVLVPTVRAVAWNAAEVDWQNLAVLLAAKRGQFYAALLSRQNPHEPTVLGMCTPQELLDRAPRPLHVTGEALDHVTLAPCPSVEILGSGYSPPLARGVWWVGKEMAATGAFTPPNMVLPIYPRRPEALRLWEMRKGRDQNA
jgi:tRNA threonylcarbamoyl adenosine modification protein YeaZ